jgi:hypothetical protein
LLLCTAAALAACSTSSRIKVDTTVDPAAQFSSYRSYGFVPMPATNIEGKTTALTVYFMKAIRHQMDSRGYRYTEESPDLLVNFNANRRATADTSTHVTPMYGYSDYYGYRAGLYNLPYIGVGEQEETVNYKVGTANVDVVDARKKMLIWEGLAEGRLTEEMVNDGENAIGAIVADMFAKYPGRAAR